MWYNLATAHGYDDGNGAIGLPMNESKSVAEAQNWREWNENDLPK
jgi:hypothetical protein